MSKLSTEEWETLTRKLAQPFETMDFLPKAAREGRALALPFIDARDVIRRLNAVCGGDWSFDYDVLSPDGKMVKGRLTVCGVTRCDAGEADKEEEPLKSAVSDALKRAAVHFGIGQYLYYLPQVWASYDQQRRRWLETPKIEQRVISRAVALAIGETLGEQNGYTPAPLPSREEAAANRAAEAQQQPESRGDQKAQEQAPATAPPDEARGRNYGKTPQERMHNHYMGEFRKKFGAVSDDTRHAVEAILVGRKAPLQAGDKKTWEQKHYNAILSRMAAADREDLLAAALELVNVNRPETAAAPAPNNYSGLAGS